jgi:hypothetical protein
MKTMSHHRTAVYYAWSRAAEISAPLSTIEDRFPTLFESRRLLYPRLQDLSDPVMDQGIAGFLDQILTKNFTAFVAELATQSGRPVLELERGRTENQSELLNEELLSAVDTFIILSFDSCRTMQHATPAEINAARTFLDKPGNLLIVSLHHVVGRTASEVATYDERRLQEAEFRHHGDRTLPPRQAFGGFGRSLLAGLDVPVENQFGLRPAAAPDGSPAPIEVAKDIDRLRLLDGVPTLNLHPHLPHLGRLGESEEKLDVLARQQIDMSVPPHPFTKGRRTTFDAVLQSRRFPRGPSSH